MTLSSEPRPITSRVLISLALTLLTAQSLADSARIAVASNFRPTLLALVSALEKTSEHEFEVSSGSTGMLYAQVINGAPFNIFLAADTERPRKLAMQGYAAPRTYATGHLVFWMPRGTGPVTEETLENYRGKLAMANPRNAPYGKAAKEIVDRLDKPNVIVTGNNVAQVYQFIQTESVSAGFVARSQVINLPKDTYWSVPNSQHSPLEQQLIVTSANAATEAFLAYLDTRAAKEIIESSGYTAPK